VERDEGYGRRPPKAEVHHQISDVGKELHSKDILFPHSFTGLQPVIFVQIRIFLMNPGPGAEII